MEHPPPCIIAPGLESEIIVANESRSPPVAVPEQNVPKDNAEGRATVSYYPQRKRTSMFNDLNELNIGTPISIMDERNALGSSGVEYTSSKGISGNRGVLVGHWRDSPVPDENDKHAVIGFIDVRDRLRTRIRPTTTYGKPLDQCYPIPTGTGGSWVTFERIVFSRHLVGLNQQQVKEYVRLRSVAIKETEDERMAAEVEAVREAIRHVEETPSLENLTIQPPIAYGVEIPGQLLGQPEPKRRKCSGAPGSSGAFPTLIANSLAGESPRPVNPSPQIATSNPITGTHPTRILLGYWRGSDQPREEDRHAVYGILGQNGKLRAKIVRETRDGRYVDGNFPLGAGAFWVLWKQIALEPHLKTLSRMEIKKICRERQYQLGHGEKPDERVGNEVKTGAEAQTRCTGLKHGSQTKVPPTISSSPIGIESFGQPNKRPKGRPNSGGHKLQESRRLRSRPDRALLLRPVVDQEGHASRNSSADGQARTDALARREIARVRAAQTCDDRRVLNRQRAAAAAAEAASTAAATAAAALGAASHDTSRCHESENIRRLNDVWARQESCRVGSGSEDAKIYDGIKYERKQNGPLMGKLVSQGTIITIDGDDFVEYRVLTKPAFF